ncbi:MAG: hypothetical protein L3J26_03425, partial [Candidatus Polarisedimenticolaceae bacterium]|nr:hypothetical protein [Candidatus Polarisedimenticolaceae bacterium]
LKAQGIHDSWETIRQKLKNQQRITVSLSCEAGKRLHIRKATRAEPHQKVIYERLGYLFATWLRSKKQRPDLPKNKIVKFVVP